MDSTISLLLVSVFLIGAAFGSFLSVVIDRLSTGRSVLFGRSYCEHCKKALKPIDLIPLVSYLLLKGKCRFCKAKIPVRLFVVELICGITLLSIGSAYFSNYFTLPTAIFLGVTLFCFIGIFFADIEYGIIPDALVVVSFFSSVLYLFVTSQPLAPHFFSAVGSFLFFLILFLVTKGKGMGFGDVKLSLVLGLFLGFPNIIAALYIAFLTGAGVSIILVIWRKIRFFGGTIPFGPFLIAAAIISFFYGETIIARFMAGFL